MLTSSNDGWRNLYASQKQRNQSGRSGLDPTKTFHLVCIRKCTFVHCGQLIEWIGMIPIFIQILVQNFKHSVCLCFLDGVAIVLNRQKYTSFSTAHTRVDCASQMYSLFNVGGVHIIMNNQHLAWPISHCFHQLCFLIFRCTCKNLMQIKCGKPCTIWKFPAMQFTTTTWRYCRVCSFWAIWFWWLCQKYDVQEILLLLNSSLAQNPLTYALDWNILLLMHDLRTFLLLKSRGCTWFTVQKVKMSEEYPIRKHCV